MSLSNAINIGRSALTASQIGLNVAGNNIANASTPGFTRQTTRFAPAGGVGAGGFTGRGVFVEGVTRQVNEALQSRLRASISAQAAAQADLDVSAAVETMLNELSDADLSSQLSSFFNSWSEQANLSGSPSTVVQQAQQLTGYIRDLRDGLVEQQITIDRELGGLVERADAILDEVADLNVAIAAAEGGQGEAGTLRDRRDILLGELSELVDIETNELPGGAIDVLIGSTPVVLGGRNRGLTLERESTGSGIDVRIAVRENNQTAPVTSGRVGAMLDARENAVIGTIERLDDISSNLIFEVNKLHSTGRNVSQLLEASGTLSIATGDRSLALNDPNNASLSELPFAAENGSFLFTVRDKATGAERTIRVEVDLDGRDNTGAVGFTDDTSAEDIRAAINAVSGISASFNASGQLQVNAAEGFEFSFSEDSSGALAVLGVNAFFTGENGSDIGVDQRLVGSPSLVTLGRLDGGDFVENGTALGIAQIEDNTLSALGGESIRSSWDASVQIVGNRTSAAINRAEATAVVREGLEAQRAGVSGVSLDEESINLLDYQRQYEGAARLISVADEMLQTLLALV
ncbi:MAG: flagellar hook-associated protein FlgK [Planctomycetota bacterium]